MFRDSVIYFLLASVGFAVDLSVYLALLGMKINVYTSYIAALAVGLACNVALLRRFFKKGRYPFLKDVWLTYVSNGFILLLGFGLYSGLMGILGVGPLFSKLISNGFTFVLNFAVRVKHF